MAFSPFFFLFYFILGYYGNQTRWRVFWIEFLKVGVTQTEMYKSIPEIYVMAQTFY